MTRFHNEGIGELVSALDFLRSKGANSIETSTARTLIRSVLYENFDTYKRRYKWASTVFVSQGAYNAWKKQKRPYDSGGEVRLVFEHIVPVSETIDALRCRFAKSSKSALTAEAVRSVLKQYYGPTALIRRDEELKPKGAATKVRAHNGLPLKRGKPTSDVFCRYRRAKHIRLLPNPYYPKDTPGYYSTEELACLYNKLSQHRTLMVPKKVPHPPDKPWRESHRNPTRSWNL